MKFFLLFCAAIFTVAVIAAGCTTPQTAAPQTPPSAQPSAAGTGTGGAAGAAVLDDPFKKLEATPAASNADSLGTLDADLKI